MSAFAKFKTLDEFIDYATNNLIVTYKNNNSGVCFYLVKSYSVTLASILQSSTNTPSQFDLAIITAVNFHMNNKHNHKEYLQEILDVYKNRKD